MSTTPPSEKVLSPLEKIRARRLQNPLVQQNERDALNVRTESAKGKTGASAMEYNELRGLVGTPLNSGGLAGRETRRRSKRSVLAGNQPDYPKNGSVPRPQANLRRIASIVENVRLQLAGRGFGPSKTIRSILFEHDKWHQAAEEFARRNDLDLESADGRARLEDFLRGPKRFRRSLYSGAFDDFDHTDVPRVVGQFVSGSIPKGLGTVTKKLVGHGDYARGVELARINRLKLRPGNDAEYKKLSDLLEQEKAKRSGN